MKARFIRYYWENEARTIASFCFKPDGPYQFTPGQYADVTVPHDDPDDRGLTRTMTFTSSPSEDELRMTMRMPISRPSSFKHALLHLHPGAEISVTDAMGDMVLPLDPAVPLIFACGGVGIASYISMVLWLLEQHDKRDITLLYAVSNLSDIVFQDIFDRYGQIGLLSKHLFTSDEPLSEFHWNGTTHKDRLRSEDIISLAKPESQIYISGTQQMVEQLTQELKTIHHVPQYRVAFDYFEGYSEV